MPTKHGFFGGEYHEHAWGKWEIESCGYITKPVNGKESIIGRAIFQKRTCSECGYTEMDKQEEYLTEHNPGPIC